MQQTMTVTSVPRSQARHQRGNKLAPGILLALGLGVVCFWLGRMIPEIGGPLLAITIGIVVRAQIGIRATLVPGLAFTSRYVLQAAIVLLGAGLSLGQVWQTGRETAGVMLITLGAGLATAAVIGYLMGIPWRMCVLIGGGTSICGASAIAALSPVVEAKEDEVAYSISTVFLFSVVAVFAFPALGHMLAMDDQAFGLWSGTAINDTSSVVAAAYSWSYSVGVYATVVKLARTTMIVPIVLGLSLWKTYRSAVKGNSVSLKTLVPWFVVWFLVAALLNSTGLLPIVAETSIAVLGTFLITMALAAIGLSTDFQALRKTGLKPVGLGLITWITVAATGLLAQGVL